MGPELTEMLVRADAIARDQTDDLRCFHVQQPQREDGGAVRRARGQECSRGS